MDNKWVVAGIVVGAGLLIGSILGPIVRKFLAKEKSPEALRELAPVIGSFVFWLCVSFGLILGLGSASPGSLDPIPTKLVTYFPKVMVAGLLIIAGKVAGSIVGLAVGKAIIKATGENKPQVGRLVQSVFVGFAAVIAVGQLGVDTAIINMVIAAMLGTVALGAALLIGFGGRDVSRQLAAGRYLRRVVKVGDTLTLGDVHGKVVAVWSVTIEIQDADGSHIHVPHAAALEGMLRLRSED